jgi:hypothetical protein
VDLAAAVRVPHAEPSGTTAAGSQDHKERRTRDAVRRNGLAATEVVTSTGCRLVPLRRAHDTGHMATRRPGGARGNGTQSAVITYRRS